MTDLFLFPLSTDLPFPFGNKLIFETDGDVSSFLSQCVDRHSALESRVLDAEAVSQHQYQYEKAAMENLEAAFDQLNSFNEYTDLDETLLEESLIDTVCRLLFIIC